MSKKKEQAEESKLSVKEKAREIALATIEKQYGKGAIINMGTNYLMDVPAYGTGVLSLDLALGRAIPKGRIIEIYGPESSGKTTLTLHIAANAQKHGHRVGFIDAEYALDTGYAAALGVKVDELDISQPDSGEQALNILQLLVESGAYGVLIVDSVAALTPQNEINGEVGDSHMGLQARMMSQSLRKLTGAISRSNTTVIFINQLRMKIGVVFGNPETTTGGRALPFYASQRIDIRRIGAIKDGEDIVGNRTKVKIIKNKVAPPFKEVELDIMYGLGIERSRNLLTEAVKAGIVQKAGAWYSIGEEKIGQGAKNAAEYIKEKPEIMDQIEEQVLLFYKTGELPC